MVYWKVAAKIFVAVWAQKGAAISLGLSVTRNGLVKKCVLPEINRQSAKQLKHNINEFSVFILSTMKNKTTVMLEFDILLIFNMSEHLLLQTVVFFRPTKISDLDSALWFQLQRGAAALLDILVPNPQNK